MKKKLLSLLLIGLGIGCTTYIPSEIIRDLSSIQTVEEEETPPDIDELEPNIPPSINKQIPEDGITWAPNNPIELIWGFDDADGPKNRAELLASLSFMVEVDTLSSFATAKQYQISGWNTHRHETYPGTTYYWRVSVTDGKDTVQDNSPWKFYVGGN